MKPGMRNIIRNSLDQQIPAMQTARRDIRQPGKGWLQAVRDAIGMTRSGAGKAIGVTRQSYTALEHAEADRSITLKSLERAAAVMHCDVVYFLVPQPQNGGTFAALAQEFDPVFQHLQKAEHSMSLEGQAVGDLSPPSKPS
jgi:predicted DNA-binding mobile mystery protein A